MKNFLLTSMAVCLYVANSFAQCDSSKSSAQLNVNNINATIDNDGMLWTTFLNGQQFPYNQVAGYEAPKGGGVSSLFTGALWIGGIDQNSQLHLSASTYRQYGYDYSVGPINYNGSFNFDTVWAVYKSTIDSFKSGLFNGTIPSSINYWPGKGNPHLPTLPNQSLAPFVDVNTNGIYDPANGDYPDIKGDEATWEVFNDGCAPHTESGGLPLLIEVHLMAYAFNDTGCLNNTTFYQYEIINDSTYTFDSTYIGVFVDPDLGWYDDDYIGCDSARNMGICYNGDADDGPGIPNYGNHPPLLGVQMVNLPESGNNNTLKMSHFVYWNNTATAQGNPMGAAQYYNYLTGRWRDSSPFTYGGNGYGGTSPANYVFPSDPSDTAGWSECSATQVPSDMRFMMDFGPFTFKSHAVEKYTFDVVFYYDTSRIIYPCPAFKPLDSLADCVVAANVTGINQLVGTTDKLLFYPNPMSGTGTFTFKDNTVKEIKLFTILGEQVRDYNNLEGSTLQITVDNLSAGIYIYTALLRNGNLANGKIVIQ